MIEPRARSLALRQPGLGAERNEMIAPQRLHQRARREMRPGKRKNSEGTSAAREISARSVSQDFKVGR